MQDVVTLPVTLSERRSARNRQEAYLAFSLVAIERTGIELNQVTIATAYDAFRKTRFFNLDCGVTHVVLAGAGLHLLKGLFHDFASIGF